MNIDERDKRFAEVGYWISLAFIVGGSVSNAITGNYTQAGVGFAVLSALFCFRIALRELSKGHVVKMQKWEAKLEEAQAEARRAQANAKMGEMALESMEQHIAKGGGFSLQGDIPLPRRGPAH